MKRYIVWAFFATVSFTASTQASSCSDSGNWQCADGSCIAMRAKCDGKPDCPDKSDETHAVCHDHYCHPTRFRCAYGACVDNSAPCNDFPDCVDRSDELVVRCHNTTIISGHKFLCANGDKIPMSEMCDGEKQCSDGSDETVAVCTERQCRRGEFQCKYGACVSGRSMCDPAVLWDCADGSDEDHVLCNRTLTVIPNKTPVPDTIVDDETSDSSIDISEPKEKILRITFVAMQPYQEEYSDRDSSNFLNFSKSLVQAVDKIYEEQARNSKISGTQRATVVKIEPRASDDFSFKVTLDIVTKGYYDMEKISKILRDHIRGSRSLEAVTVSDAEFSATVFDSEGITTGNDATICREDQWKCQDGSCISEEGRCNGQIDCPDRSDESHAVCRKNYCHESRFRCQYGACVDRASLCNGVSDCADGSDEIPRVCRNETQIRHNEFNCNDGETILANVLCDGQKDCADGSDETLDSCAGWFCAPSHFQCAYGACVNANAKCDLEERWDCADGSDEDFVLCNRARTVIPNTKPKNELELCIVPDYPEHGKYTLQNEVGAAGNGYQSFQLSVECDEPYRPHGPWFTECKNGQWTSPPQQCKQFCELPSHDSITYLCGDRKCESSEPSGTVATPQCKSHFVYKGELKNMNCIFSNWDYIPTCIPEIKAKREGNKIILYIGKELVVYLDGSQYAVSMEYDSKKILNESVPNGEQNTVVPNAPNKDTVVPNKPRRLNPVFHRQYDPIAWSKKHDQN